MAVHNFALRKGLNRFSASRMAKRRFPGLKKLVAPAMEKKAAALKAKAERKAAWEKLSKEEKAKRTAEAAKAAKAVKPKAGASGRKLALVLGTAQKKCAKKTSHGIQKLRPSLVPGTILIVLAGRFKGRRVVFLKQLPKSGLLLVTGPYKLNGCPLRRISASFVIATSTKVDISSVAIPEIDEKMFKKPKAKAAKKGEAEFFNGKPKADGTAAEKKEKTKKPLAPERKALQKQIDKPLLEIIKKTTLLPEYLMANFTLRKGQYPHEMCF